MKSCYRIPWLYIVLGILVSTLILAYLFQWQAILGFLPWLFVLACPLMHLMHGHGHDDHSEKHDHT